MTRNIRPTRQAQYESDHFKALCERLAANLKAIRRSQGDTQADAAKNYDMSLQQYQKLEVGRTNVTFTTLARVVAGADMDVADLLAKRVPGVPEKCYAKKWDVGDTVDLAVDMVKEAVKSAREARDSDPEEPIVSSGPRSPIRELVDALEQNGSPEPRWLKKWSARGADPVLVAWRSNNRDPEAMLRLLLFTQAWPAWRRAVDAARWAEPSASGEEFESARCAAVREATQISPSLARVLEICKLWRAA